MKRIIVLFVSMLLATAVLAGPAAAKPSQNPNAMTLTVTCDGEQQVVVVTGTVGHFAGATDVGVLLSLTVTDIATGEILFQQINPGLQVNAVDTQTCTWTELTSPGLLFTGEVLRTPAND
jgi:hypothetical protein